MKNDLDILYTVLMVYAVPFALITLAGIVVIVIGYGKEKKNLKLAGTVITAIGIKLLILLGCLAWYFKFISSMATGG